MLKRLGAGEALRTVSLRPARSEDAQFLKELFASTRAQELAYMPLDENQKDLFLSMQFHAQSQQYAARYPQAQHSIVLQNDTPIGRILIDRSQKEFTLVDVALLTEHRNNGIGTQLVQNLLTEAGAEGKPVRLHVFTSNPAIHLYERMGFARTGGDQVYLEMLWSPASG